MQRCCLRLARKVLDESQPDVISVPVIDYEAADKLFLSWGAPTQEATNVEGGYDYHLADDDGKAQGSVFFRAVEGDAGLVAHMTVAPGTGLELISEVKFINAQAWPENAADEKVEAGKIYYKDDRVLTWTWGLFSNSFNGAKWESLPFYCIQGNTDGKQGILVWISPDAVDDDIIYHPRSNYYYYDAYYYLPTEPMARKVLEFYNNNSTFWNKMLEEMDAKGLMWSPQDKSGATITAICTSDSFLPF